MCLWIKQMHVLHPWPCRIPVRSSVRWYWAPLTACLWWWSPPPPVEECVRSRWVTPAGRYWPPQRPLCARRNVCGCGTARISAVSPPPASPGRTVRLCPMMPPFCPPVPIWLWPCGVWGSQEAARLCSSVRPSDSCRAERYRTAGGHPQWTEIHLQPICTNCPHRGSWQHDPFYWSGRTCRQDVKLVNDK